MWPQLIPVLSQSPIPRFGFPTLIYCTCLVGRWSLLSLQLFLLIIIPGIREYVVTAIKMIEIFGLTHGS